MMPKSLTRKIIFNSFWLSLLLHALFFCFITTNIIFSQQEKPKKSPNLYVPSYVYTGKIAPAIQSRMVAQKEQPTIQKKTYTEPAKQEMAVQPKQSNASKKSLLAASLDALRDETRQNVMNANKNNEPIYLVGEENAVSDPLIELLGKALSANFAYPRMAGEFGIQGRVVVRLTLHPEGFLSDVEMLESSNNRDLDAAALYAVNSAPTIIGADRFLGKPRRFVIGFIFKIQSNSLVRFQAKNNNS